MIVAAVLLALLFICVTYALLAYNGLVSLRNQVRKDWSNIDVLLKQRHDEIPRLVECCKGYMQHEQEVLVRIMQARNRYQGLSRPRDLASMDQSLRESIGSLYAVAENYPSLAADRLFLKLQSRIGQLEDSIADRREYYNDRVTQYNTRLESLPDVFLAKLFQFQAEQWFSLPNHQEAKVPHLAWRG